MGHSETDSLASLRPAKAAIRQKVRPTIPTNCKACPQITSSVQIYSRLGNSKLRQLAACLDKRDCGEVGGHSSERYIQLGCLGHPRVDFAAQHPKIDRLGEKRISAALQCFALGVRIAIGGDHNNGHIRACCLGL